MKVYFDKFDSSNCEKNNLILSRQTNPIMKIIKK